MFDLIFFIKKKKIKKKKFTLGIRTKKYCFIIIVMILNR